MEDQILLNCHTYLCNTFNESLIILIQGKLTTTPYLPFETKLKTYKIFH